MTNCFIYLSVLLCFIFIVYPKATGNNLGKVKKETVGTENIVLVDLNFYYSGNGGESTRASPVSPDECGIIRNIQSDPLDLSHFTNISEE